MLPLQKVIFGRRQLASPECSLALLCTQIQHLKEVMVDLEAVLTGSINRPSQYPPELIEQVLWQSERLWHAMSAKAALLHSQAQVPPLAALPRDQAQGLGVRV